MSISGFPVPLPISEDAASQIADDAIVESLTNGDLKTALDAKVDEVAGKDLSDNNFTDTNLFDLNFHQHFINESGSAVHSQGGNIVVANPLTVDFIVQSGGGFAFDGNGDLIHVEWPQLNGTCIYNGDNYINIDNTGNIAITPYPETGDLIAIGYISTALNNTVIVGYSNTRLSLKDNFYRLGNWLRLVQGTHVEYGLNTAMQASPNELKLTVSSGVAWSLLNRFEISDKSTFTKLINTSNLGFIPDSVTTPNEINTTYWNDVTQQHTSALVPLTAGYYKKDLVCVTPEGSVFVVYGDAEYATFEDAQVGSIPKVPANLTLSIVRSASVITQQGGTSVPTGGLKDIRPIPSRLFETGVVSSPATVISHSDLVDLNTDSHPQYLNTTRGDERYNTKQQIIDFLALKANLDSPVFTGTPTAPTQTQGNNSDCLATTQFVNDAIAAFNNLLTNGAPELLNQLNEFANAINNDPDFAVTIADDLATKLSFTVAQILTTPQKIIAKTNLGIENIDNTSDADKPISTSQQQAFNAKLNTPTSNGISVSTGAGNGATVGRVITGTANRINVTNGDGVSGNPTLDIAPNPVLAGNDSVTLPVGTTAQRGSATAGKLRFNTTLNQYEGVRNGVFAPLGKVVQLTTGTIAVQSNIQQQFFDNLAPDTTAGFSIASTTFTPVFSGSNIVLEFSIMCDHSNNNRTIVTIVNVNGLLAGVTATNSSTAGRPANQSLQIVIPSQGAGVPLNIDIRAGANGGGTTYINRGTTASMGNTGATTWTMTEYV